MEAEMILRPMTAAEQMYSYSQSQQISMQTGLIGYLRADMDSNGKGFFSSWKGLILHLFLLLGMGLYLKNCIPIRQTHSHCYCDEHKPL